MATETMHPEIHFFVGKGGVGKSTSSALTGLSLAAAGQKTLLVSMDPAHNQQDIFQTRLWEKPREVCHRLRVQQVDTGRWMATYLKQTREQIRKTYLYQSAFNLEHHFKILELSPGLEEYALLLAFEDVLAGGEGLDAVIFDMAPTALSLRFFALPAVTLVWLEELLCLRKKICEKKEIISKIRFGSKEIESDRVKNSLAGMIRRHQRLRKIFGSPCSRIHLVLNDDPLSLSEAVRIRDRLADQKIAVDRVTVNKSDDKDGAVRIGSVLGIDRIRCLPSSPAPLIGLAALTAFLATHPEAFHDFLFRQDQQD